MDYVVEWVLGVLRWFFAPFYEADRRPEARRVTVQMTVIVILLGLAIAWFFVLFE